MEKELQSMRHSGRSKQCDENTVWNFKIPNAVQLFM